MSLGDGRHMHHEEEAVRHVTERIRMYAMDFNKLLPHSDESFFVFGDYVEICSSTSQHSHEKGFDVAMQVRAVCCGLSWDDQYVRECMPRFAMSFT